MYRKRLISTTGCTRCKLRHVKCDEARPTCSFCKRWNLPCVRNVESKSQKKLLASKCGSKSSLRIAGVNSQPTPLQQAPDPTESNLDAFLRFSLPQPDRREAVNCLHHFLVLIQGQNLPYQDIGVRNKLAQGWFESALLERAACTAMISYWSKLQSIVSGHARLKEMGLKLEIQTLSILRRWIASGRVMTEENILTAAVHFISAALDMSDGPQLRRMLYGIKAMIDSSGGMHHVLTQMRPSTVFSVQHVDVFNSLVNADTLVFVEIKCPDQPPSLAFVHNPRQPYLRTPLSFVDIEVIAMMDILELQLCFRHPSRQKRSLLHPEYEYLQSIEFWSGYQLGVLQHKYVGTGSIEEVIIVSLILVKHEVFAEGSLHSVLVLAVLRRLRAAILHHDQFWPVKCEPLITWACFVSLLGKSHSTERLWFSQHISAILMHRYGGDRYAWPSHLEDEVRNEVQQFPWHPRIDHQLEVVCAELRMGL